MSGLPSQLEVALQVGRALEAAGCEWMIGGSIATSAYGEPRATNDVDLVANLRPGVCAAFVERLGDAFYVDLDVVRDAARRGTSFNVIHFDSVEKIDVFCVRDAFAADGLKKRVDWDLGDGLVAPVAPPGHMVVEKLRWYRRGGEVSDRQLRDVQGVLQTSGDVLDLDELRRWAGELGLSDLLEDALVKAGLGER
ncbi:MAG: hypothetical protein H6737_08910 [Alphaproteobacteria bacterium]|nr:hypothetical protein [Alphaproteobacteria bacterium]